MDNKDLNDIKSAYEDCIMNCPGDASKTLRHLLGRYGWEYDDIEEKWERLE